MSEPAISAAFFDPEGGRYASLRSGVGVLFRGDQPEVPRDPPELERAESGWRARIAGDGELAFEPVADGGRLGGAIGHLCHVRGRWGDGELDCLGTVTETSHPPSWSELDATRSISAVFDERRAMLLFARRPRGARGHGDEETVGWLLEDGELRAVEEARISTIYDGDGRQRSSGVEIWLPGEDFPRRAAGEARAGASLSLEGLTVHVAVFGWRMEGREGAGAYELSVRGEGDAAA